MFHKLLSIALVACLAVTVGCDDSATETDNNANATNNGTPNAEMNNTNSNSGFTGQQTLPSSRPRVRFKGGQRWGSQLARGLGIGRSALCQEFDKYDCINDVHDIALGGVEPYRLRINEPLPSPPITAPIAAERIALTACSTRAEKDVEAPADAVIFKELGAEKPSEEAIDAMGTRLYRNLLSRDAEAAELAEFGAFWDELDEAGVANLPVEWATMSCFAVATSTEMLFY